MTISEKRNVAINYCMKTNCNIVPCALDKGDWKHEITHVTHGGIKRGCLDLAAASVEELDEALRLIKQEESEKGAALVKAQVKELKRTRTTIELETLDNSPMQIAYAICEYFNGFYGHKENALIALEELSEHIDSYIRAWRHVLENEKLTEEE